MKMKFVFSAPASIIIIFRVSIDGSIYLNTVRLAKEMLHLRKCSGILVWILVIWTQVFMFDFSVDFSNLDPSFYV